MYVLSINDFILDSLVSSEWQIGGGFTRHHKCELRQMPLRGTRTLVDALRTGLHGGRGLHSAPVRRRSGSGAKRQQTVFTTFVHSNFILILYTVQLHLKYTYNTFLFTHALSSTLRLAQAWHQSSQLDSFSLLIASLPFSSWRLYLFFFPLQINLCTVVIGVRSPRVCTLGSSNLKQNRTAT